MEHGDDAYETLTGYIESGRFPKHSDEKRKALESAHDYVSAIIGIYSDLVWNEQDPAKREKLHREKLSYINEQNELPTLGLERWFQINRDYPEMLRRLREEGE